MSEWPRCREPQYAEALATLTFEDSKSTLKPRPRVFFAAREAERAEFHHIDCDDVRAYLDHPKGGWCELLFVYAIEPTRPALAVFIELKGTSVSKGFTQLSDSISRLFPLAQSALGVDRHAEVIVTPPSPTPAHHDVQRRFVARFGRRPIMRIGECDLRDEAILSR